MWATTGDGVQLWFERTGEGPPVVLIPGRGDSSDLFPQVFTDQLVGAGLSVVRSDPRDTGLSGDGGGIYTVATMAEDVVAILDAAGVGAAHVVAVSMGGLISVHLATRHSERVTSLTFVSAMSPDPDAGMGEDFFAAAAGEPLDLFVAALGDADEDDRRWASAELERAAARAPSRPDAVARHQEAAFRLEWPTLDALGAITVPVSVVHGRDDRVLPVAHAVALGRGTGAEAVVVREGMGHLPRPRDWEIVAELTIAAAHR